MSGVRRGDLRKIQAIVGAPGGLSGLNVRLLVSAQVTISWFMSSSPHVGLRADSAEPAGDSHAPSLSAPPLLSLSLSQNKHTSKKIHAIVDAKIEENVDIIIFQCSFLPVMQLTKEDFWACL